MSASLPARPARHFRPGLVLVGAVVAALAIGGWPRLSARDAVKRQTAALAQTTVALVKPVRAPRQRVILLPGDVQPYQEASIYARTSGYLQHWYVDIGAKVHAGQPLAQIDAPEVEAELAQARSDAAAASANYQIAKLTAERWQTMLKSNAVSRQSAQENTSLMHAKQALLAAAQANVARLEQLHGFEKVNAPFNGVVTARNVDVGALINAGAGTQPAALFRVAETDRLRVFVNVPQDDAAAVSLGAKAQISLSQFPGRHFAGTVARTNDAIDPSSRTLRVEVDVDNADGLLLPGSFAQVSLPLTSPDPGLSLPANTLLFRASGVTVAVVDAQGRVQLRTVTLGRDFGDRVEIASGLQGNERVVANPNDAIRAGEHVRVNPHPDDAA